MALYVYSPEKILPQRIREAELILGKVRAKHAFITGSFLYKRVYKDIDLFVVTRSRRDFSVGDKRVDLHVLHPNRTGSLFYHSATKLCVSKSVLPRQPLRATMTGYWAELNWCLTPLEGYDRAKETRSLVLLTSFHEGRLLDSEELSDIRLRTQAEVDAYAMAHAPAIFRRRMRESYLKRRFYGRARRYGEETAPTLPALIRAIIRRAAT